MPKQITEAELAHLIYDSYPEVPIDPDEACVDLETLEEEATHAGDGLFTFIAREINEAADREDLLADAIRLLNTAVDDITAVRDALENKQLELESAPATPQA